MSWCWLDFVDELFVDVIVYVIVFDVEGVVVGRFVVWCC